MSIPNLGIHVPDEEVVELIKVAMDGKAGNTKGFIIDGFPANLNQAKVFEEKIGSPEKIIVLNVNDIILKERLTKRSNFDDQPDAVDKRLETYNNETKAVVKAYAKLVKNVRKPKYIHIRRIDVMVVNPNGGSPPPLLCLHFLQMSISRGVER